MSKPHQYSYHEGFWLVSSSRWFWLLLISALSSWTKSVPSFQQNKDSAPYLTNQVGSHNCCGTYFPFMSSPPWSLRKNQWANAKRHFGIVAPIGVVLCLALILIFRRCGCNVPGKVVSRSAIVVASRKNQHEVRILELCAASFCIATKCSLWQWGQN